jgi:hypothetical protein
MHPAQLARVRLLHDIMILVGRFNNIHLQQTHFGHTTITKLHSSSTNKFWAHYYKTAFIFNKHILGTLLLQNCIHLQQTHFGPTITKLHSSSTNKYWAHYYKTACIFNKHILGPLSQNSIHLQQTYFGPTITKLHSSSTNTFRALL